jgi:hypothetical protein
MKATDFGTEESWNLRMYDGGGDTGYVCEITRSFFIRDQSEDFYAGAFQNAVCNEWLEFSRAFDD